MLPMLLGMLAPQLMSALGLSGIQAALGAGALTAAGSYASDPDAGIEGALLNGALSGLGGLIPGLGGAAEAGADVATQAGAEALKGGTMGLGQLANPLNPQNMGKFSDVLTAQARDPSIASSVLGFAQRHPMMTAAGLALPALLPNEPEYDEEEPTDIPENFPSGPGPRAGYDSNGPVIPSYDDYSSYGQTKGSAPGGYRGEWQFFPDNELRAPPSEPGVGEDNRGGGLGGGVFGGVNSELSELIRRWQDEQRGRPRGLAMGGPVTPRPMNPGMMPMGPGAPVAPAPMLMRGGMRTMAGGGEVFGPGGPREDKVPAVGPGNMPIRLSAGEYVMPAQAVDNAGGPEAMDQLRARLTRAR